MKREYEVTTKTTSANEALCVIATLPKPVCIVIIKDDYNLVKEYAYRDIINKIKKEISAEYVSSASQAAELISPPKKPETNVEPETNVILIVNDKSGDLHKTISGLRAAVDKKQGSLVGIRAESALHSAKLTAGCSVNSHSPISDCLNCLITIHCS